MDRAAILLRTSKVLIKTRSFRTGLAPAAASARRRPGSRTGSGEMGGALAVAHVPIQIARGCGAEAARPSPAIATVRLPSVQALPVHVAVRCSQHVVADPGL